ncbi:aldehyde dehydrogenase (NAD+) [Angulomicrobium tetraedrale]|uniref:Aldehyde dehydrogenase (NAD+) n=1 Tax=Ancylobacter tetraedralis TaxID=217068 RepID=A0A839Z5Z0_9HYPH|nr:aldehyde dehydrogenase family protein [Ancylobacter tetraedralis]MBB3769458.1 aldehyde dehydrogenase (NAD+) [Ancylobacter tetraedralis]
MDIKANYIGGAWHGSGEAIENRSPSDMSDLVGLYAQASLADVDAAVEAAGQAGPRWAATPLEARLGMLDAIGQELIARAEELGRLLSREEGKPLAEGIGEVRRSGQFFTYFAAEVLRQLGETADSVRPGIEIDVRREPVGVVAILSPWNFPMATAAWKIAPALAFGNAVVWKPANLTPASAFALAEIISRQKLPAGTCNLVMGPGGRIGDYLAAHAGVRAISFTGSLEVGRSVAVRAAGHLARVQLEMGSKNPLLVMDDADLDLAVTLALNSAFGGSGQKCTAASRLIVHRGVHDAFVEKLLARLPEWRVGHALEPGIAMGPVVSAGQLAANLDYVALGTREGAERVAGGVRLERPTEGFYMAPTVFVGTRNDMAINREEMFAPITCVIAAGSYEEALALANDSEFGLTAGIVTRSLARANHFRRHSKSGCVMVNLPTAGTDYHVPFGGMKASSYGPREQGRHAVEFYTQTKTSYVFAGGELDP